MGLGIEIKCKKRLKEKLEETLTHLIVEKNYYLGWSSNYYLNEMEVILPQSGSIHDKLEKYIGENPFSEFVSEYISKKLKLNNEYNSDAADKSLTSLPAFSDTALITEEIIESFDSLPWGYSVSVALDYEIKELFIQGVKEFSLSEKVKLIAPGDDFIEKFSLKTIEGKDAQIFEKSKGILNMVFPTKLEWDKNKIYLSISTEGFIKDYGYTATYENVITQIKAFWGLGIALRLHRVKYEYHNYIHNLNVIIHRNTNENWNFEYSISLDEDISQRVLDLKLHDLDGVLVNKDQKVDWMKRVLNDMGVVFNNTLKGEKIFLAAKWFFESYIGTNELLSFIQCNIALEILLGDKAATDLIGLGELLANRCAYLIGNSSQQRESILKEFKQIYKIRSNIVHSGKSKLSQTERDAFIQLQWMCRRVIYEEIELLKGDIVKK